MLMQESPYFFNEWHTMTWYIIHMYSTVHKRLDNSLYTHDHVLIVWYVVTDIEWFQRKRATTKNMETTKTINHSIDVPLSSGAPRRYKTLLHLIRTSPRFPVQFPSIYSSVFASCRFMYASTDTRKPLYSMPHLSFTMTGFPVSSVKKGLGFTGMVCSHANNVT